jgi:hypothetical protein
MVGLREQFAAQEIPRAAFKEMLRWPESVGQHIQIKISRFVPQFKHFLPHQTVDLYHPEVQTFAYLFRSVIIKTPATKPVPPRCR